MLPRKGLAGPRGQVGNRVARGWSWCGHFASSRASESGCAGGTGALAQERADPLRNTAPGFLPLDWRRPVKLGSMAAAVPAACRATCPNQASSEATSPSGRVVGGSRSLQGGNSGSTGSGSGGRLLLGPEASSIQSEPRLLPRSRFELGSPHNDATNSCSWMAVAVGVDLQKFRRSEE